MKTLCFDFGNTRRKAALFDDGHVVDTFIIEHPGLDAVRQLVEQTQPERTILTSVIHHEPAIEQWLSEHSHFHLLSASSQLNFQIVAGKKETIGADRIALLAAAAAQYPQRHVLIISMGTCITYNFLNRDGAFLGGAISPGLDLRFRSMHDYTALLPIAEPDWNYPLIGYNTNTNLVSGVMNGMLGELEYTIDQYEHRFGNLVIVLTGGRAPYFASRLKNRIFADSHFLFKGLYALSSLNS
ncbi:MAG: type III pantothenate kinase [Ferruginibacter sp.]